MKVFVSGSSSRLARALLPRLCADPGIEHITGTDLQPPVYTHEKFRAHQADMRSAAPLLAGHDALIHLAYVVLRGKMPAGAMHETNVAASLALFRAARIAGMRHLIHLSSAAVYGAGVNLTEDAPFNPLSGFLYAQHKAELERLLAAEFSEHLVVLRPHLILGPHAQPLLRWLARQPFYPRLPEPQPQLQCVHEDDVAQAILLSLHKRAPGAYNLAAADSYSFRDVAWRNKFHVALPLPVIKAAATLAWKLGGWGGEPGWLQGIDRSLTLDCRKAMRDLGWRPHHSAQAALAAL